jgi:hypothetical protein
MACILINASSVDINLNNKTIEDNGCGCPYGIANYGEEQSNIGVHNGRIGYFYLGQVAINNVDTGDYHDLTLFGTAGDGIKFINPLNQHIRIRDNHILTQDYSINGICMSDCTINNNELDSFGGVKLNGMGFLIDGNKFGDSSDNSGQSSPCTGSESTTTHFITCDDCWDSIIRNNEIHSNEGFRFLNDAHKVIVQENEFLSISETNHPIVTAYYDSSTYNNTFCYNQICHTHLTIADGVCWYQKICENAVKYVENHGIGNSISDACTGTCSPRYFCDGNDKVFIDGSCNISERVICEWGCKSGACIGEEITGTTTTIGITPSYNYNVSWMKPILNETEVQDAGIGWILPFTTPFFFAVLFMFGISGTLAYYSKSALVGGLSMIILIIVYALIGIFPMWLMVLLGILSALMVGMKIKEAST